MGETSKIRDKVLCYCQGKGVDIGCGGDKVRPEAIGIDLRKLPGVDVCCDATKEITFAINGQFDYVYSSHFLEHVYDPIECLTNWTRILKEGGHLILYLPHKDYYTEYNPEHKQSLTMEMVIEWLNALGIYEIIENHMDIGKPHRYSFLIVALKKGA